MNNPLKPGGNRIFPGSPAFDDLVQRVIYQESRGNPRAVSPAGAAGLMQVMPATARDPGFGVRPLDWNQRFNPRENERFGRDYLGAMLNRYDGDPTRALIAYNAGPGTADRWSGDPNRLNNESRGYVANILQDTRFGRPQYGPGAAGATAMPSGGTAGMGALSARATQAADDAVGFRGQAAGEGFGMGAQPASNTPGAQTMGGFTDMVNLQTLAAQPAGFSRPTQQVQTPQSRVNTPRVQSGARGPIQQMPQMPTPNSFIR